MSKHASMINKPVLPDFISSPIGYDLWLNSNIQMMLQGKEVFRIYDNYEITKDELKLINDDGEFTDEANNYIVEDFAFTNHGNWVFLSVKEDEDVTQLREAITFDQVNFELVKQKLSIQVGNANDVTPDDTIANYLPEDALGTDFRYLYVAIGSQEWVLWESDEESLLEFMEMLYGSKLL